jgi:hypothetical protein
MKQLIKFLTIVFVLAFTASFGQIDEYDYKREITGITEQWHTINLPDAMFGKISQSYTDIRIFGITRDNDTIEAPYILKLSAGKTDVKRINFKQLNSSQNRDGFYFTFEIPNNETINQIELDFDQQNFDWKIELQGSHNQNDWFTILKDYRILSISNELTNYQFTKLTFPDSRYRYFRINVKSTEKPVLKKASIIQQEIIPGTYKSYPVKMLNTIVKNINKETEIQFELPLKVPVSVLKINVSDSVDYYRPFEIKYLVDSTKTELGWRRNYVNLTSGILNSLEENKFKFSGITAQKFKVFIKNNDNLPLKIASIEAQGYVHQLVVRFTEPASYYLTYGSRISSIPRYDIEHFKDKIPGNMPAVDLGSEQVIEKVEKLPVEPLFKNKMWLWAIIILITIVLGWYSIKMIHKV